MPATLVHDGRVTCSSSRPVALLAVLLPLAAHADRPCEVQLGRGLCIRSVISHHGIDVLAVCRRQQCLHPPALAAVSEIVSHRTLGDDQVELRLRISGEAKPTRITIDVAGLDADMLEDEAYHDLRKDRFTPALAATEKGLAIRPQDEQLLFERVAALTGLGRADEARAAWRPLATRSPIRAYAAAANFPVLRRTLDFDELAAGRVTPAGTARMHASGEFATDGVPIAFAPDGTTAVLEEDCQAREDAWLRVGQVRFQLGWSSDPDTFHETGITAINRMLQDRGFRFVSDAEVGLECAEDALFFKKSKLWLVGKTLRRAPPRGADPSCDVTGPPFRDAATHNYYVPALRRVFTKSKSTRACGDGGADPVTWSELPVTGP
jgi:hypothetical protein